MTADANQPQKRKVGRPRATEGRDPKYLVRYLQVLEAYHRFRDTGSKYEAAIAEAREHLNVAHRLRVSETEIKRILADSHDNTGQYEFSARPHTDAEGRQGLALFVREKVTHDHPSRRAKKKSAT